MAASEITVDVKVGIPTDTVERCLRIIEMWMDDNPHCSIVCVRECCEDRFHYHMRIERKLPDENGEIKL